MNRASIDRLRASYRQIAPDFTHTAERFYDRLFAAQPATRDLFTIDITTQAAHLAAALALIVRNLPILDSLEGPLMELGASHTRAGVRPEHYPVLRTALLATLAEDLGDHWTPELADDWRRLLERVASHMLAGTLPGRVPPTGTP
jgi:hemoglobin-like flavoprotein